MGQGVNVGWIGVLIGIGVSVWPISVGVTVKVAAGIAVSGGEVGVGVPPVRLKNQKLAAPNSKIATASKYFTCQSVDLLLLLSFLAFTKSPHDIGSL